jgi:putative thioredoxin
MNPKNIPLQGAVDLAALAAAKTAAQTPPVNSPFVIDITDQMIEQVISQLSMQVPVILDLWATWCQPCKQLSPILEKLAVEANGSWVLAKVDVDANPGIAQAFQAQSIPSIYLVLAGKVQPLFQGVQPESAIRQLLEQIMQVAKDQNLPGLEIESDLQSAAPVEIEDPAADLLMSGDLAGAAKIYTERLKNNPADGDAKAALALIALQLRAAGKDLSNLQLPEVTDLAARMDYADGQILAGNHEAAYELLIATIKATVGDEREQAKQRLLELFEIAEPADPIVLSARRALANALY